MCSGMDLKEAVRSLKRRLQESLPSLEKVAPAGGLLTPQPSDSEGEDLEPSPPKIQRPVCITLYGGAEPRPQRWSCCYTVLIAPTQNHTSYACSSGTHNKLCLKIVGQRSSGDTARTLEGGC